jgi:tRNA A37 threonylcarbamoyladenosine dehydratase
MYRMDEQFSRIKLLYGEIDFHKIQSMKVILFGCGGVGSAACEALIRSGVQHIGLVDFDVIASSNLNRQLHTTQHNVNQKKIEALKERCLSINPETTIETYDVFVDESEAERLIPEYDAVIDALDTLSAKEAIIVNAIKHNKIIVSSMGMGNRFNPTQVTCTTLNKTTMDPLAKMVRYRLRQRGVYDKIPVVFSLETPIKQTTQVSESEVRKHAFPPASAIFVPVSAGLAAAYSVIEQRLKGRLL